LEGVFSVGELIGGQRTYCLQSFGLRL